MQPIVQFLLLRHASDKFLDSLQLVLTVGLNFVGVVENISPLDPEDESILNVVAATLSAGCR